jgi:hypothetical protein
VSECGPLSYRGKCRDCGDTLAVENALQLHAHSGPHFEYWLRRCRAAFGVAAVDDDRAEA